jgi:DNA-binding response OmpR family regulator
VNDEPRQPARILVVIVDPQLRQLVGWLLDNLDLAHVDVPSWRRAVATTNSRLARAIVDLDAVGENTAGLVAFLCSGWGEPVPFIGLSHRADVEDIATRLGAAAGLRKPINAGLLIATVERTLGVTFASPDYPEEPTPENGRQDQPQSGARHTSSYTSI